MSLSVNVKEIRTRQRVLVQDLTLIIPNGSVATLMGASGSGKSSVLSAIAGTVGPGLEVDAHISLYGRRIDRLPSYQRQVGLLFQDDLLFAHMTVAENLLYAVPAGNLKNRLDQVHQALQEAGLEGMGNRDPSTLSGGQRARVALMRALLAQPQALLLDEPFSKLDAKLREQFRAFVFAHIRKRGIPALLVSHDSSDIADTLLVHELENLENSSHA